MTAMPRMTICKTIRARLSSARTTENENCLDCSSTPLGPSVTSIYSISNRRSLLGCSGVHWCLLGCSGVQRCLLRCSGVRLRLLGCSGVQRRLLGCSGVQWHLLGWRGVGSGA
jgi:hypothetical protein